MPGSYMLVFNQSNCINAIKRILSTTAMYTFSSSFLCLCFSCYCDACLKSSGLRVGVEVPQYNIEPTLGVSARRKSAENV